MMPDRNVVIKGLEYCEEYFNCCDKCPYWDGGTHCTTDLAHDALDLLKEQDHLIENLEYNLEITENSLRHYINSND